MTFEEFIVAVLKGNPMIPSEEMKQLCRKAINSRKNNRGIHEWARTLANDVKDATD